MMRLRHWALTLIGLLGFFCVLGGTEGEKPWAVKYQRYAVAAEHDAASNAGAQMLANGGNAADAAAAALLALGVVSPSASGLGGGGFALYYRAKDKSFAFLDFRERAPLEARPDMFKNAEARTTTELLSQPSQLGGLATAVPGAPAGIDMLMKKFGSLSRRKIVEPAVRLAEQGNPVSSHLAKTFAPFAVQLRRDAVAAKWFGSDNAPIAEGQVLRMRELGRTLRTFGRSGAAPFYRGAIARHIVTTNRRAGGLISSKDLRDYRVVERMPLEANAFGARWVTAPPPSAGGFTMLQSLALLEQWGVGNSEQALYHRLIESWKGPFLDRQLYAGDPDFVSVPVLAMLDEQRMERRAIAFSPYKAVEPPHYNVPISGSAQQPHVQPPGAGTSHLCVVDAEGNVASVTATINLPFGARYTVDGMLMNNEMDDFARELGASNAFGLPGGADNLPAPGKRPVSTMTPTIVMDDHGPRLCIGGSGGSRIVTAVEQVALRIVAMRSSPDQAIMAPRVHHQASPNVVNTEEFARLPDAVARELGSKGHKLEPARPSGHIAEVQLIQIDPDGLIAVSDPRKGGIPAGE